MSFQAYLDAIETKTGKTPDDLLAEAGERGYDAATKATVVADWLKVNYGLGRGHAMALYYVLKNGAEIGDKHVGPSGTHRDESTTLRTDGGARHHSLSTTDPNRIRNG